MANKNLEVVVSVDDKASGKLKKLGKNVSGTTGLFSKFTVAAGLAAGATGLIFLGKSAIEAAANFEQSQISFTTMLGSAEKAQKLLNKLAVFAKKTPFTLRGIEQNTKQLLAMGIEQEKILPTLKALGDVSAGLSVPMERLALNFGQVKAQGRLTGRELRDFAIAGVPLLDQLAVQMGKSKAEITKMVSAGKIGFDEVEAAFMNLTSEGGRFNNLMDKQSSSLNGMISNLGDAWDIFLRGEGQKLLEWAKLFIELLIFMVENVLPIFINFISDMGQRVLDLKNAFVFVFNAIKGVVIPVIDAIASGFERIINIASRVADAIRSVTSLSSSAAASNTSISDFLGTRANGGPVSAGRSFLVGERGPELFTPNQNGSIIPNNKIGGGVVINITGNQLLDEGAAEKIGDVITERLGFHGAMV